MTDITEYDYLTGEVTTREYSTEERQVIESFVSHGQDLIDASLQEEADKIAAKEEAIEVLKTLGLTEAQARAIAGI